MDSYLTAITILFPIFPFLSNYFSEDVLIWFANLLSLALIWFKASRAEIVTVKSILLWKK